MAKFPLEAQVWNSERRTYCAILAILFSGFVISVPWTFMYEPIPDFNDTNAYSIEMTNISLKTAGEVYRFWLNCVVLVIIPWMIGRQFFMLSFFKKNCHAKFV